MKGDYYFNFFFGWASCDGDECVLLKTNRSELIFKKQIAMFYAFSMNYSRKDWSTVIKT